MFAATVQHVKRSLIGQSYDHVAYMNSESVKELLKLRNSVLVSDTARGKVCDFAFLTSSSSEFFVTFALVVPPLTVKNRPYAHIWACALNQKNTVYGVWNSEF